VTTAQDGGRLSALCTGRFLHPGNTPVYISVRGWVDPRAIVRSGGLYQWKIPMTPAGIEPATFRFVAQHLNYCATGPRNDTVPVLCHIICPYVLENQFNFVPTHATTSVQCMEYICPSVLKGGRFFPFCSLYWEQKTVQRPCYNGYQFSAETQSSGSLFMNLLFLTTLEFWICLYFNYALCLPNPEFYISNHQLGSRRTLRDLRRIDYIFMFS